MWRTYQWTAMLGPVEISHGVDVDDVTATTLRGRLSWLATCRPLLGEGEDWENGYGPQCGCYPLLESAASRIMDYGPEDPTLIVGEVPMVYCVHVHGTWTCRRASSWTSPAWTVPEAAA